MPSTLPHDLVKQAYVIHEALMRWLLATYPHAAEIAVVTACSYEIGRIVGKMTEGLNEDQIEVMLDGVVDVMRQHIAAFREGLQR